VLYYGLQLSLWVSETYFCYLAYVESHLVFVRRRVVQLIDGVGREQSFSDWEITSTLATHLAILRHNSVAYGDFLHCWLLKASANLHWSSRGERMKLRKPSDSELSWQGLCCGCVDIDVGCCCISRPLISR